MNSSFFHDFKSAQFFSLDVALVMVSVAAPKTLEFQSFENVSESPGPE